jgi:hypothetical protein
LAHPSAPHCSILLSQTDRPSLASFDNQDYPFSLIVVSVNRMKLGLGGGSRVQAMSRTAFVGDQMTYGGQKGFGMTKHGRSGHATRSPRFRFLQKLEAQKNDRKDRCACRKLNPGILVMQSAENWATKNVPSAIDGARDRCIFLQG